MGSEMCIRDRDKIVSIGIQRKHVKCIQRFRTEQVDVTFCTISDGDLFLSKVALCFQHHSARAVLHLSQESL